MSLVVGQTYQAVGINLKGIPLGENDRLITVLTREYGLLKLVAVGARKYQSGLAGRSLAFRVNQLVLVRGRTLDKIRQADPVMSFPQLSQDFLKLTCAQYLGEIALMQALTGQPQVELFELLVEHYRRIDEAESRAVLPHLVHGIYHLLAIAGFAPSLHRCCLTQRAIGVSQAGFSVVGGGLVALGGVHDLDSQISHYLTAEEVGALQELGQVQLTEGTIALPLPVWLTLEKVLRACTQYYFDQPLHSPPLLDNYSWHDSPF
ncbi:MAG: DNA repair protein RecO [Pseudanabaenaceae cyanobacterium]